MRLRNGQPVSPSSRHKRLGWCEDMKAKPIKILAWTLGMALGVYLITDGKTVSAHPLEHALIGAAIGAALGFLFSSRSATAN